MAGQAQFDSTGITPSEQVQRLRIPAAFVSIVMTSLAGRVQFPGSLMEANYGK